MSAERPRILLIKPVLPYPPNQGTRVVSFNLIRVLRERFAVTVLARVMDADEARRAAELETWCERVVVVPAPNRASVLHRIAYKVAYSLRALLGRRSLKSLYDCPGAFVSAARRLAAEPFDVVIVEYWQLYPLLDLFPADRTVLFTHDIDLLVNRQMSLLERNLFRKLRKVRRWLVEQREEVMAYKKSRRVLALTERDAKSVRTLTKERTRVDVLPFGVEPDAFAPPGAPRAAGEVLFMGAMGAAFNQDALNHFVHLIYPRLDPGVPFQVTVVGGDLPRESAFFSERDNVEVVGRVDDVGPYLARATCLVVPMRFGGGLRIRILEAMMAGLPTVCTSVAIAGMDFEPEEDYLLADDPGEFAAAVGRLIRDGELAARIGRNARRKVLERYGAEAQARRAVSLFEELAGIGRRGP